MSYPLAFLFLLLYLLMCQILPLRAETNRKFLEQNQQQNRIYTDNFDKNTIDTSSKMKGSYE